MVRDRDREMDKDSDRDTDRDTVMDIKSWKRHGHGRTAKKAMSEFFRFRPRQRM
jgi:hypothetical protein